MPEIKYRFYLNRLIGQWHENFFISTVKTEFLTQINNYCMKNIIFLFSAALFFTACNNSDTDSVEKADSTNQANRDTALERNTAALDEKSSSFLVDITNSGMAEVEISSMAQDHATYTPVKNYAAMLHKDHSSVNDQVKMLATQKNVTLPLTISDDKQKDITDMRKNAGVRFDKEFIKMMIKNHESSIDKFEGISSTTGDADIKSFADRTLPTLRAHLDSAKALQNKYW